MNIFLSILLFSFLIVVHELGHFAAAKLSGVQVNEFSLFMGPAIFQKQWGQTLYSLRCIPFGGYCAMEGEEGDSNSPHAFSAARWWKRMIILIAGAAMNFIAGVLLLAIVYAPAKQFILPVVESVEPQCKIAGEYGILPGDRIVKLDGENIYLSSDFSMILSMTSGDVHDLVLDRQGKKVVLNDFLMEKTAFPDDSGGTVMRYGFDFTLAEATPARKLAYIWNSARNVVRMVRLSLRMLFGGQAGLQDVAGPVGIVKEMSDLADSSGSRYNAIMSLLYFGGFIGINLAVMNLLPIPALDGGRVVGLLLTTAVEAITRQKLDPKYEGYIHGAGMMLLIGLMAVIMFKDIFFIIKG